MSLSGKTIVAELSLLRMKKLHPTGICVYVAPLKSLARERLKDWKARFSKSLGWQVLELSGDTHHDQSVLKRADVLVCTPEKWDLISRGWRGSAAGARGTNASNGKAFVKRVKLLVIDEIHLVGVERGAVLEAIVSRTRFISRVLQQEANGGSEAETEATRIIGLSTALENPTDIADWCVEEIGRKNNTIELLFFTIAIAFLSRQDWHRHQEPQTDDWSGLVQL